MIVLLYLQAPGRDSLLADLGGLGLVQDEDFVPASDRHDLFYFGQVSASDPAVYACLRCKDVALAVAVRRAAFGRGTVVSGRRPDGAPMLAGESDVDLEAVRADACASIDAEAERRRLLILTPGAGQALEYQHTAEEAARAVAAPDPLPAAAYPFLAAEQEALMATIGEVSLRDVAVAVLADRAAWLAYGASIKAVRRRAKLQVGAAGDVAAIAVAVAEVVWPDLVQA